MIINATLEKALLMEKIPLIETLDNEKYVFTFTDEGLSFTMLDSNQIELLHFIIKKDMFETYSCKGKVSLHIASEEVNRIYNTLQVADSYDMSIRYPRDKNLVITCGKCAMRIGCIVDEFKTPKLPSIKFTSCLIIDSPRLLSPALRKLKKVCPHIVFVIKENEAYVYQEGEDTFQSKIPLSHMGVSVAERMEDTQACYNIDNILSALTEDVRKYCYNAISLSTNTPLQMKLKLLSEVEYYLAPRIDALDEIEGARLKDVKL